MSLNKFIAQQGNSGLHLDIKAASITSDNLQPLFPVKTNLQNKLVSTKLDISDVNDLENNLNQKITNPLNSDLDLNNNNLVNADTLKADKLSNNLNGNVISLDTSKIEIGANTKILGSLETQNTASINGGLSQLNTSGEISVIDRHRFLKPGGVTNGNEIYKDEVYANDNGNVSRLCGQLRYSATDTHSSGNQGTNLGLWTTSSGTSTPVERLLIRSDGSNTLIGSLVVFGKMNIGARPVNTGGYTMITPVQVGPNNISETTAISVFAGSLTIPPNTLLPGSTSVGRLAGSINADNNATITLRLKIQNTLGSIATIELDHQFPTGVTNSSFTIETLYTVLSVIGTVSTIAYNTSFTYKAGVDGMNGEIQSGTIQVNSTLALTSNFTIDWGGSASLGNVWITKQGYNNNVYQP
tara:strand:- start:23 stop:1258 length:1236 start_codon:yes stop_codon:yes gene_type:complete